MDASFWHERWQANQIGFHKDDVNERLVEHLGALALPKGARVFVPLCGKTLDIGWLLGEGYAVTGAELSEIAVRETIHGRPVKNLEALANPQALDQYRSLPELSD